MVAFVRQGWGALVTALDLYRVLVLHVPIRAN